MYARSIFFLGAAAVCLLLVPVSDAGHRAVAVGLAGLYVLLAILSALDTLSRTRHARRRAEAAAAGRDQPRRAPM